MKILFDAGDFKDINSSSFLTLPSYKQISHLSSRAICAFQLDEDKTTVTPEFQRLGIDSQDLQAQETLHQLISSINKLQIEILPSDEASGVYTLQTREAKSALYKNIAVFKIGHKRAAIELQARKLAFKLGLEAYVIPSSFAVLEDPDLFSKGKVSEELWNGNEKEYIKDGFKFDTVDQSDESSQSSLDTCDQWFLESILHSAPNSQSNSAQSSPKKRLSLQCYESFDVATIANSPACSPVYSPLKHTPNQSPIKKTPQSRSHLTNPKSHNYSDEKPSKTVVGILQPYITPTEKNSTPYSCVQMTMAALAIGLRDAKEDGGIINDILIDVEDCMPNRLDAPKTTHWTQLAAATHLPYLDTNPNSQIAISHEELKMMATLVASWDIDKIISEISQETIQFKDESAEQLKGTGIDDGGCHIKILKATKQLIDDKTTDRLANKVFSNEQLAACTLRLERMKAFINKQALEKNPFTAIELVLAIDLDAKKFYDRLVPGSSLRASTERTRTTSGRFHIIGKQTPVSAGIRV